MSEGGGGHDGPHLRRIYFIRIYFNRSFSSGPTHSGARPAATRSMLSKPLRKREIQFSAVGPAGARVKSVVKRE